MKLELLQDADYVLSACGLPNPPPGYRFVDLYRVIPYHFDGLTGQPGAPFNQSISNNSDTLFLCLGIVLQSGYLMRVKWPSGRFLSQQLEFVLAQNASPQGTGSSMIAFETPVPIRPDQRVSIQISGLTIGASVDCQFWGVLRYLMKDIDVAGSRRGGRSEASCIVGYPSAIPGAGLDAASIADPIAALQALPRYLCTPNQNIMAPEWALGNQCTPETPDDYTDEAFTFFSPVITVPSGSEVYGVAVIVPSGSEDVVIKGLTFYVTLTGGAGFVAIPTVQIRLPNGYSVTGGDYLPVVTDFDVIPSVFQIPVFPTLRVRSGDRIIIDAADMLVANGPGTSTVKIQFDGCKRRKRAQ